MGKSISLLTFIFLKYTSWTKYGGGAQKVQSCSPPPSPSEGAKGAPLPRDSGKMLPSGN